MSHWKKMYILSNPAAVYSDYAKEPNPKILSQRIKSLTEILHVNIITCKVSWDKNF